MKTIELTIVASRRPGLLHSTLESFSKHVFRHFQFSKVSINIDPIWGSEQDLAECVKLMHAHFSNPVIYTPEKPSYCLAVQRLWKNSQSDIIFHLEDDWEAMEDIDQSALDRFTDPLAVQVSLMAKEKNWDITKKGDYHYVKRRPKWLGIIPAPYRRKIPAFTVSPAFVRGDFARKWASMMDENLDPEKQAYNGFNPAIEAFAKPYKNYFYIGKTHYNVVQDTGRKWRDDRKIDKKIILGESIWTENNEASGG